MGLRNGRMRRPQINYVSDVDVIFVAAEDEDLADATAMAEPG